MPRDAYNSLDSLEGVPTVNDYRLHEMIGLLLRCGVTLSALLVAVGLAFMELEHRAGMAHIDAYASPEVRLPGMRILFHRAFVDASPSAWMNLGLIVLILTPVMRVAGSLFVLLYERDHQYVGFTLVVITVLICSLSIG